MALLAASVGLAQPVEQKTSLKQSLATRAEQALREGRYDLAARQYEELVKLEPKSAELWSNLGAMRALAGECSDALPALERARSLNTALFAPWYFSGFCHLKLHAYQQALGELRRALDVRPEDANAWYFLAEAGRNLDESGLAFDAIVHSLALDTQRPETYYAAGKISLDLAVDDYARLQPGPASSAFVYRLEGERDAAQGVRDAAIVAYRKAAQLAPLESDIPFALGTTYLKAGKFSESEAAFRRCLELVPNSTLCRLGLTQALAEEGRKSESKSTLDSVPLEHLQAREEFEVLLASAALLEMPELADQALRQWSARFPEDPGPATWRSRRVSDLSRPTSQDPPSVEPRNGAVATAVRFLAVSNPPSGNALASAFRSPARYRDFRAALIHDDLLGIAKMMARRAQDAPSDPAQLFIFGETFHWLSLRFYEVLGRKFPDSSPAQMLAAETFSSAGQQDKALEIYQAILARDGPSIDLLQVIAQVYWTQARWDEALRTLKDLMQLDPRDATVYVNAGRIYSYRQDFADAERNFQRAAEVDPNMFEAHLGLGETYRRQGRDEDATREFRQASGLDPSNPRPHYQLAQLYRKLGRKELADSEMKNFQELQTNSSVRHRQQAQRLVPLE